MHSRLAGAFTQHAKVMSAYPYSGTCRLELQVAVSMLSGAGDLAREMLASSEVPDRAGKLHESLKSQQNALGVANSSSELVLVTGRCQSPFADWLPEESKELEFHVLKPPVGLSLFVVCCFVLLDSLYCVTFSAGSSLRALLPLCAWLCTMCNTSCLFVRCRLSKWLMLVYTGGKIQGVCVLLPHTADQGKTARRKLYGDALAKKVKPYITCYLFFDI